MPNENLPETQKTEQQPAAVFEMPAEFGKEEDTEGTNSEETFFDEKPIVLTGSTNLTALILKPPVPIKGHVFWVDRTPWVFAYDAVNNVLGRAKSVAEEFWLLWIYVLDQEAVKFVILPKNDVPNGKKVRSAFVGLSNYSVKFKQEFLRIPFEIRMENNTLRINPEQTDDGQTVVLPEDHPDVEMAIQHSKGLPEGSPLKPFDLNSDGDLFPAIKKKLERKFNGAITA